MNPSSVDLKPWSDVVEDQGVNQACTGYAGAKCMDIFYARAGQPLQFSPMFLWAKERELSGVSDNEGVTVDKITKVLQSIGVCLQSTMPDNTPFSVMPSAAAVAEAAQFKISASESYSMLGTWDATLERIKTSIAKGRPVLCTMFVHRSLELIPPGPWQQTVWDTSPSATNPDMGVHMSLIMGYADAALRLCDQNSWGPLFGDGGYFGILYKFVTDSGISPMILFTELTPASVPLINAGWRADLTASQHAVQQAYIAYFGRPADLPGLNYWAGVAASNPLSLVLDDFAASAESKALYPSSTPAQVITAAYQNLFGRAPDAPGLAYWSNIVTSGAASLGAVIYAILQGAQGTDAAAVAAKVEAASVATYCGTGVSIPAARAWLAAITTEAQVQPAVQSLPL